MGLFDTFYFNTNKYLLRLGEKTRETLIIKHRVKYYLLVFSLTTILVHVATLLSGLGINVFIKPVQTRGSTDGDVQSTSSSDDDNSPHSSVPEIPNIPIEPLPPVEFPHLSSRSLTANFQSIDSLSKQQWVINSITVISLLYSLRQFYIIYQQRSLISHVLGKLPPARNTSSQKKNIVTSVGIVLAIGAFFLGQYAAIKIHQLKGTSVTLSIAIILQIMSEVAPLLVSQTTQSLGTKYVGLANTDGVEGNEENSSKVSKEQV